MVIIAGKEYHRECYASMQPQRVYSSGLSSSLPRCEGCSQVIREGQDKNIVAGREWHKSCWGQTQLTREPRRGWSAAEHEEICSGCGGVLVLGKDTVNKVVVSGKEWHKECYYSRYGGGTTPEPSRPFVQQHESCPGCGETVEAGMNRGEREKIVIGGKEWHKDCYNDRQYGTRQTNVLYSVPPTGGRSGGGKFCTQCGTANSGAFCSSCGTRC